MTPKKVWQAIELEAPPAQDAVRARCAVCKKLLLLTDDCEIAPGGYIVCAGGCVREVE